MVGVLGFEPRTSSLSGTRSNQLSYTPLFPLKVPPFAHGPRVFCFAKASGTFRGPRSPAFRAASPYSCLRDWMMSAKNRLVPDCLARYFLIFRSRCDNGAPRHPGAARLPPTTEHRDTSERHVCHWWSRRGSNPRHPACKAGALAN